MLCVPYDLPHGYVGPIVYRQIQTALIWEMILANGLEIIVFSVLIVSHMLRNQQKLFCRIGAVGYFWIVVYIIQLKETLESRLYSSKHMYDELKNIATLIF